MKKRIMGTACGAVFAAGAIFSTGVYADQREDAGLYIGASYGLVSVDDSEFDDDNDAPQAYIGYQINPYLGIEASYLDFGSNGNDAFNVSTDGYGLALTGRLPLTESFAVYGKVGQFWWESDVEALGFDDSFDGSELAYGIGVLFEVSETIDFRVAYDRMDVDLGENEIGPIANGDFDSEVDIVSAGIQFEF